MKATHLIASTLTAAAMIFGSATVSFACVHGMDVEMNEAQESIYTAEDAFYDGDYTKAVGHMLKARPDMRRYTKKYEKAEAEEARAFMLLAISVVRLDGKVKLTDATASEVTNKKVVLKNMAWATRVLEKAHARDKDNTEATSYLAEAYAKSSKTQEKALTMLGKLAKDDLMVDAMGWATLAKLQEGAGDKAAAAKSTERCITITADPSMCGAKPTPKEVKRQASKS